MDDRGCLLATKSFLHQVSMLQSTQMTARPTADALAALIEKRAARVGVVGLGYVGLPLAHAFHAAGLPVLGFDVDPDKIVALESGRNYLRHLGDEMTTDLSSSPRFEATSDLGRLGEADAIIVCVPTPLGRYREPDLSFVTETGSIIGRSLRRGQLIVLESTTYPGTTRVEFLNAITASATELGLPPLECGVDYFVAYSPEREDPGRKSHNTRTIPKLVGGLDEVSTKLAFALYSTCIADVRAVETAEVAEAAKLLENIFRSVNIAMVNEMKVILEAMNINIWKVIDAASSKPFGFMPFYPGPGLGGHCIPIDPFYLTWKAKEYGYTTRFIELAGEINTNMPNYVIPRLAEALNERARSVRGSRVLILGLAYKADVDDTRESPSFELIERLHQLGAHVEYSDPHVAVAPRVRRHDFKLESVRLTPESVASFDAVLVATAHKAFDFAFIASHAKLIIDTRNAFAPYAAELGGKLVRA
jgi:UDP-N-acetyl-D-glucosamine dehydrogenase